MATEHKISNRLQRLIRNKNDDDPLALTINLKPRLAQEQLVEAKQRISSLAAGHSSAEFISISGTIHCLVPAARIKELEALQTVESIDVESEASQEELLD